MRRTYEQLEEDYQKIVKAIQKKQYQHFSQIIEDMEMSYACIINSFKNHPDVLQEIRENMKQKKPLLKPGVKKYVLDISFLAMKDPIRFISTEMRNGSQFILTDVTQEKLEYFKQFSDRNGKIATTLLTLAANKPNVFSCVSIDTNFESARKCILHYCHSHRDDTSLVCTIPEMKLSANRLGIFTIYQDAFYSTHNKLITLYAAKKEEDQLWLHTGFFQTHCVQVFRNKVPQPHGLISLSCADHVYLATKKDNYISFADYEIIDMFSKEHAILGVHCRIHDYNSLCISSRYSSFIKTAIEKFS